MRDNSEKYCYVKIPRGRKETYPAATMVGIDKKHILSLYYGRNRQETDPVTKMAEVLVDTD